LKILTNLRNLVLRKSAKDVVIYQSEKVDIEVVPIQLQKWDTKDKVMKRLKDNFDSMEMLFRKEMKICLEKLLAEKHQIKNNIKKVGKDKKWIGDKPDETIDLHGKLLGLVVGVFHRKVKWKQKRGVGMHRKTIWKGEEILTEMKYLPETKASMEEKEEEIEFKILIGNYSGEEEDKNTTKFNAKVCSLAILKYGSTVDCELQSSKELVCHMNNFILQKNNLTNVLNNIPLTKIDTGTAISRNTKFRKGRTRKKNCEEYPFGIDQTMMKNTRIGEENQKMLPQVWSNAKRKSGNTVTCIRKSLQKHFVHSLELECMIKVYKKWKENSKEENFLYKRRSKIKNLKPLAIMEDDKFEKFVIDTHSWRNCGSLKEKPVWEIWIEVLRLFGSVLIRSLMGRKKMKYKDHKSDNISTSSWGDVGKVRAAKGR
jgi:hypothetical protein